MIKKTATVGSSRQRKSIDKVEDGGELSSGEDEDIKEVKVRWKAVIVRVAASKGEKAGKVMDRLAEVVGLRAGDVNLYCEEDSEDCISRDVMVASLGLTVATVLHGRARVEQGVEQGGIQLRLQTKDRRAQPVILHVRPTDKMSVVVDKFIEQAKVQRDSVKFFFDGEQLNVDQTAEELDMEGGECIDVHLMS